MGSTFVIAGQKSVKRVFSLDDPAIHQSMVLINRWFFRKMDARVKPAHDS